MLEKTLVYAIFVIYVILNILTIPVVLFALLYYFIKSKFKNGEDLQEVFKGAYDEVIYKIIK